MPLTPGQCRLYSGDYNYMNQKRQPDGTVIVTVSGGRSGQAHRLHVRDLWGENEEVLTEVELDQRPPPHIRARFDEVARLAAEEAAREPPPEGGHHDG